MTRREPNRRAPGTATAAAIAGSAGLLVLAAPPFDLWPLAFLGLVPVYRAIRGRSVAYSAAVAGATGALMMALGSAWWPSLLRRFADLSWPAAAPTAVLFCLYQALPFAVWGAVCAWLTRGRASSWLFVAPLVMALAETLVPFFFKSYLAITVWRAWPLLQVAEIGGPPAVSGLIVLGNVIVAEAYAAFRREAPPRPVIVGAATFFLILGAGALRAAQVDASRDRAATLRVGIVQPNHGLVSRQARERRGQRHVERLRRATAQLSARGAQLIVWPESSWPFLFDRGLEQEFPPGHPWALRPQARGTLLIGALTRQTGGYDVVDNNDVYNSAILFDRSGRVAGRYDKNRLVPFAEYVPGSTAWPERAARLRRRFPDWPEITPGEAPVLLVDRELRIAPLICSEDIDPRFARTMWRLRPNLVVALVSDAWFGDSAAPFQHLALASFRAVEARRDMVRATNNGVSAIVDAVGRVRAEGRLVAATGDTPTAPDLLVADVGLLPIASAGPRALELFPYGCLSALVVGSLGSRKRPGGRPAPDPAKNRP